MKSEYVYTGIIVLLSALMFLMALNNRPEPSSLGAFVPGSRSVVTVPSSTNLQRVNDLIAQLYFEQSVAEFASDANAEALPYLLQARLVLEGKSAVTVDGLPLID